MAYSRPDAAGFGEAKGSRNGARRAELLLYHFGRGLLNKTFCRKCGVSITNQYRPESEGTEDPDWPDFVKEWVPMAKRLKAVNVRVLDGVDLEGLPEAERSTGGEWPPFYKNP